MSVNISSNTNNVVVTHPTTRVVRVIASGPRGLQGIQGPAGSGDSSQEGTQGIAGAQGTQGVTGLQGLQGIRGIQGLQGLQGTQGLQGIQGTEGIQGTQGTVGIQGPQGIGGIQGTTGAQGVAGSSGTSIDTGSFATTGSNTFTDNQVIQGSVTASFYFGNGRYLTSLPGTTNWNYNQEFVVKKTEQLTFSGDYILEDTYLLIENDTELNSIGDWTPISFNRRGVVTPVEDNGFSIEGPADNSNASDLVLIRQYFENATTLSVNYVWNGEDIGDDWPFYDISEQEPSEPNNENRLQDINAISESGTWTLNVPANNWVAIGVWSNTSNNTPGTLQVTLPYTVNEDIQYAPNKYFKKEGRIFIGGNLLVKDSYIENNGQISVGGEVILIGDSQIVGTGTII